MSRTSGTHIDHFNVIVPVLWKMDEACVGAERDQLILRKQTMAVKDGTVIRGIELSLDLCGTALNSLFFLCNFRKVCE